MSTDYDLMFYDPVITVTRDMRFSLPLCYVL